ncbi:uncharacterized protein LOC6575396 [Drosophila mojavensis]|uniref:Uncharacterized protein n=1 Tax=Drosophila mojavensis TaxID=7230 RepID=B4KBE1_DROMO|nr:uncharacterized protein LOC6575396 [Drosophila mojavensis]EDW16869.1 uncharacterized protein Dmoj_GI10775 [Drosophila mojavensis]
MLKGIALLCFLLLLCGYIKHNYAATKVFYEFHIREQNTERNETVLNTPNNNKTEAKPDLIITGKHTSSVLLNGKDENSPNSVYTETAFYTADDSGYHVTYNVSIQPAVLDPQLNGVTLKVIVG